MNAEAVSLLQFPTWEVRPDGTRVVVFTKDEWRLVEEYLWKALGDETNGGKQAETRSVNHR